MTTLTTEQSTEQPQSLTFWRKFTAAQQDILYVQKTGVNTFHRYNYAKEEDYLGQIKPILGKYGLAITSTIKEKKIERYTYRNKENRDVTAVAAEITMVFEIVDSANGEKFTCEYSGYAHDDGDKALYKAITGCVKYFLAKEFLIATGDDPEEEEKKPAKVVPAKKPGKEMSPDLLRMNKLAKQLGMSTQQEIEAFTDNKLITANLPEIIARLEAEIEARKN